MSDYYVLNHKKEVIAVDPFEWSDFYCKDPEGRQVDKTEIDGYVVSTVFLGIGDTQGIKPTEMFETTVHKDGIKYAEFTRAHETWDEAKLGHLLVAGKIIRNKDK